MRSPTTARDVLALAAAGRLAEAEDACRVLLRRDRRNAELQILLGEIAARRGRLTAAADAFAAAIRIAPRSLAAHLGAAKVHAARGRFDQALAGFERALHIAPGDPLSLAGKGDVLESLGRLDEVEALLGPVVEAGDPGSPMHPEIALVLAAVRLRRPDIPGALRSIHAGLAHPVCPAAARRRLLFQLGRAQEASGEYAASFATFAAANAIDRPSYDVAQARHHFAQIASAYPVGCVATMPRSTVRDERPVFIVGMPRSGSTLVESILAAHPAVIGVGESEEMPARFADAVALLHERVRGPAVGLHLAVRDLDRLAHRYLGHVSTGHPGAVRIVDKNLNNLRLLGWIAQLLPAARVIWCRRSALATCFSCWTTPFPPATLPFSANLEWVGRYHRLCDGLMEHWKRALDLPIVEVEYETLVEDPEGGTRAVLEDLDLPWDPACLEFHRTRRAVATASYAQVDRPVYRSSIDRYSAYGELLQPLREVLRDEEDPLA